VQEKSKEELLAEFMARNADRRDLEEAYQIYLMNIWEDSPTMFNLDWDACFGNRDDTKIDLGAWEEMEDE